LAAAAVLGCGSALSVTTAVDQTPLGVPNQPKPNVLFLLDDSSSMNWEFMPDDIDQNGDRVPDNTWGQYSAQCNGLAFIPGKTYSPPVRADGTPFPDSTYPNAPRDGFSSSSAKDDISSRFFTVYSGTQPQMGWKYFSWGTVDNTTQFYKECTTPIAAGATSLLDTASNSNPKPEIFRKVLVSSLTPAEQASYANWYTYYRTRILMMRTGAGQAMAKLGDGYRVGFTTIHYGDSGSPNKSLFLDVDDFTGSTAATQRGKFFDMLYNQVVVPNEGAYTPLRTILSTAGRYYGNKLTGRNDPMKYSCQKNYSLLATDGYWNSDTSVVKIDGTAIGDEDAAAAFPYRGKGAVASLADVAWHYYTTDLRTESTMGGTQNMGLFTLGLGLNGTLADSDWSALVNGSKAWPVPNGTTGASTWGDATHIDDLWHAAVNGGGQYFNATNAASLVSAISSAFKSIDAKQSTGAAAASSSQTPVTGDDWLLLPSYKSIEWTGDLKAFHFTNDGKTVTAPDTTTTTPDWSAAKKLSAMAPSARKIFFNAKGSLLPFDATNLTNVGLASLFNVDCSGTVPLLSQCADGSLTSAVKGTATAASLIGYLTGSNANEKTSSTDVTKVFRKRESLLGDMVNAAPVFVGKPPFSYVDAGYASYVSANASRTKVVYVAANDGMLHAFKVDTDANGGGSELWAFVPTAVMPNLYQLADSDYGSKHRFFIDATPVLADVYGAAKGEASKTWRSILIGGQGAGGRSYFALDVTTPTAPKLLWEFGSTSAFSGSYAGFVRQDNLGLTYSSPIVTKRPSDGRWVAVFPSGLNNVSPGDGKARLFVIDALTGEELLTTEELDKLATTPSDTTRSGDIMRVEGWVDSETDNTARRFYAGDMQGNLWRFDPFDLSLPAGKEVVRIGQATDPSGNPQPITTKPLLSEITVGAAATKTALISFGTGRFLANSPDFSDTSVQTIYTVKDTLQATGIGKLRAKDEGNLVEKKMGSDHVTVNTATVDWTTRNGWYVDLNAESNSGERVVIDGLPLPNGVIAFASAIPTSTMCTAGGKSWLYQFSLRNGTVLDKAMAFPDGLLAAIGTVFVTESGSKTELYALESSGKVKTFDPSAGEPGPSGNARRTSWRELVD
jgi:type IV pilus assembly protein PilY1